VELIGALLMVQGALLMFIAGVGLHRFDDVFARMHAAGKSSTFGLGLLLSGAALRVEPSDVGKLGLVFVAMVLTIPAGVHLIARSAWRAGGELAEGTIVDRGAEREGTDDRPAPDGGSG
jgi:multicomponent Na+:H+ antiporter subunit G